MFTQIKEDETAENGGEEEVEEEMREFDVDWTGEVMACGVESAEFDKQLHSTGTVTTSSLLFLLFSTLQ